MGRAYSDITFTPAVRQAQTEMGSREQYAFLDTVADRGDVLTAREIDFIADADHFYQATVGESGWPYVQHRGGPKGFLKVLDPKRIGFADYRGNVQYLSVGNLRQDDRISLIIMDVLNRRRLKLLGRVTLVDQAQDAGLVAAVSDGPYGAIVERAFLITIEGWDWNCPQHITTRLTEAEVASLVTPLQDHVKRLRAQLATAKVAAAPQEFGDGPLSLTIAGIRQLTPEVRAYELVSADGAALPQVQAGAHLDVPMRLSDGLGTTRSYSISSSPLRRDAYEIAVLRELKGGGGSMAVHQDFALGTRLNCSLPRNEFCMAPGAHRSVLLAGGIGITPIKSMAHALAAQGAQFELHFACRSRSQAPFLGQLQEAFGAHMTVYATDLGQRLDVRILMDALATSSDHLYVCGPAGLIAAVRSTAEEVGIANERIHFERFIVERHPTTDRAFVVHLKKSSKDVAVAPGQSILAAVEAQGIRVPSSCRIGTCGTCATRVLDGTPEHRDQVLTSEQREAQGLMCVCVSRAMGSELSLDL